MKDMTPEESETIGRFFKELRENICPHCHVAITEQRQVGHCVYADPCGHRLYQGRAGAFTEAPKP